MNIFGGSAYEDEDGDLMVDDDCFYFGIGFVDPGWFTMTYLTYRSVQRHRLEK